MLNYEILEKLTRTIGVSGEEDDVRSVILSEIEPYADEIHISPLGNILAFKKGEKRPEKKLMLCAHMDEVGFIVTQIREDGTLGFSCVKEFLVALAVFVCLFFFLLAHNKRCVFFYIEQFFLKLFCL